MAGSVADTTSVPASTTTVTLKAANLARQALSVYNDSTANLYIKYGPSAALTLFKVKLRPGGYWEMAVSAAPEFTGEVSGIWDSATGNARVTEVT